MTRPFPSTMPGMHAPRYTIIIPVKRLATGKSRLRGAKQATDDLVLAIALDTIAAALAAEQVDGVLVVTNDPTLTVAAGSLGAKIAADAPDAGLNAAITHGEATLGVAIPCATLNGDLPALRPGDLTAALLAAGEDSPGRRHYVADHMGTGTTMLVAPPGVPLDPHFGLDSAQAHAASGAVPLDGDWPSLRLDVDTPSDLAAARGLGLGPRTAHIIGDVQGTVATYDPDHRDGTVLLDDGTELAFDGAAFATSGLRLLRFGQRLRLEVDADGRVVALAIPTM